MNFTRISRPPFLNGFQKDLKNSEPPFPSASFFTSPSISPKLTVLFVEIGILLVTLIVLFATKFRNSNRKRKLFLDESEKLNLTEQRKISFVSYFSIKLPNFVSGLYTLYRLKKDGIQFIDELFAKWGSFFELPLGTGTAIFISDPSIAQKILTSSNPLHLNKAREVYDVIFPAAFQDGLLVSEHKFWATQRKVLNRSFTYKSLQTYLPFMNEHGRALVSKFRSMCSVDMDESLQAGQFNELIWSETIKTILQTIMGEDSCPYEESLFIHDLFKRAKRIVQHRFLHPQLLIKPIWWFHPMRKEYDQVINSLSELALKRIDKFRMDWKTKCEAEGKKSTYGNEDENSNDLGVKQFRCMMEEMVISGASDKEIYDEMGTFVSTGHETTTLAIQFLMFHLALNPECQELCRDEIDNLLGSKTIQNPNYNLTMDDLQDLKYLERCIYESLRLTTTTPVFFRRLDAPLKIDDGLTLEAGKSLLFCPWSIHRDPSIFSNPMEFDPDRFLPDNMKQRHPYAYMPFSAGPRNCIGFKFAIMEIKVILGWLLRNFEIYTTDKPEDVKFFIELTLMPERDINITLKKRKTVASWMGK